MIVYGKQISRPDGGAPRGVAVRTGRPSVRKGCGGEGAVSGMAGGGVGGAVGPALSAGVALLAAAIALALVMRNVERLPSAQPNARSLHEQPVCRVGGLSIWAGWLPALWLSGAPFPAGLAGGVGWTAIALVCLRDDWRSVAPAARLAVQLAAAAVAASALPGVAGALGIAAATLVIAWASNLYNFMDGSDGLAATMAVLGFAALAAGAWVAAAPSAPLLALAAAAVPLLVVNAPPARVFMGDIGAVPLGFLAALYGIAGWGDGVWPAWFPVTVFLPFIADASVTLLRRALRRERVWQAHRSHYYQRLHRLGAGHRGTLLVYGALMAGTGASAVLALATGTPGAGVLAGWALALGALFAGIDYHWRIRHRESR